MKTFTVSMENKSYFCEEKPFPTEIEKGAVIYDIIRDNRAIDTFDSFEAFCEFNCVMKGGALHSWGRTTDGNYWIYIYD